jgi:hypothetical protein
MKEAEYRAILEPAIKAAIEHFQRCEHLHGAGLHLTSNDIHKAMHHAESSILGHFNPDGCSHALAALNRSFKAVLWEQMNE